MQSLGARVDALTIAARVRLDPELVARLKARAEVAREHGRASFEWYCPEPVTDMGESTERRLGPQRARWADEFDHQRLKPSLWGELSFARTTGVWRIANEPYFRIQIQERAPGGSEEIITCHECSGRGEVVSRHDRLRKEKCPVCRGSCQLEDPGWTFEIIWYAQELAASGLENALKESRAIAMLCGEVLELRVRRLDLCADVEGWEIAAEDVKRIAKRPRARWAVDDDGPRKEPKPPQCMRTGACAQRCTCRDIQSYGSGSTLAARRITGISIGRGGALMARIYDKRVELENDRLGARREAEESRWRSNGWDGVSPVARVEFQIRGVALREFGVRDPDACVRPIYKREWYEDQHGRRKLRARVVGEEVMTIAANDTGEECAHCIQVKLRDKDGERKVRLSHSSCTCKRAMVITDRLEAIWRTCLDWVRLVTPEHSSTGKPISVSRLKDDPRWALLRTVTFQRTPAAPIRRYRPRAGASAAQALGVVLSQAGRAGMLAPMKEGREHYDDDEGTKKMLTRHVSRLFVDSAESVVEWLIERYGGPANAAVHFAIRSNAKRARFHVGIDGDGFAREENEPPERLVG